MPEHLDTGVGEDRLDDVADAVAVGVVEVEDVHRALPSSWTMTWPTRRALQTVGRSVTEVEALVVVGRQRRAGVGRAELRDAGSRDLVDNGQRHARARRRR